MKFGILRSAVAATALVAVLGFSTTSFADEGLPPIDGYVKTVIEKSIIAGSIDTSAITADGAPFNYDGKVYSVKTAHDDGTLNALSQEIGTIKGQAFFPLDFVNMAGAMNDYLATCDENGENCTGSLPAIPASMDWTCNKCKLTVGDNVYVSIVDAAQDPDFAAMLTAHFGSADAAVEALRMKGRAFTGLTPVEIGKLISGADGLSMSVRMAGCSAVVAVAGPDGPQTDADGNQIPPMMGTLCLNGTFTFDLHSSTVAGTGSSNCITVLHRPTM